MSKTLILTVPNDEKILCLAHSRREDTEVQLRLTVGEVTLYDGSGGTLRSFGVAKIGARGFNGRRVIELTLREGITFEAWLPIHIHDVP